MAENKTPEAETKTLKVKIYRSTSQQEEDTESGGTYKEYAIPYMDKMTIMNVFDYVHQNIDRSLSFYKSCRIGKCTGCIVEVDGKNRLACTTLAEDGMKVGPQKAKSVIKDVMVDFS
jgi:succinate dehydrogenase / fumarate reductase, iron-sulfur subunit